MAKREKKDIHTKRITPNAFFVVVVVISERFTSTDGGIARIEESKMHCKPAVKPVLNQCLLFFLRANYDLRTTIQTHSNEIIHYTLHTRHKNLPSSLNG